MLFNSFPFLLQFLPIALFGYFLISKIAPKAGIFFLALCSIVFYIYWDPRFLPLLLLSIVFNFFVGKAIALSGSKLLLFLGLGTNLACLIFFKYAGWLVGTAALLGDRPDWSFSVTLPLGISFFTFTQIAFLVDSYSKRAKEASFNNYLLFVTYFPHLIAGPIIHHAEMMPQFANGVKRVLGPNLISGGLLFLIGAFKKVVFADSVALFVSPAFDGNLSNLDFSSAWIGVLSYTLQIYFDFSAYTDMALGLSRMFNIELPLNFNSPYKSTSIIEFWHRWHMTLSRFLRDYLYIPLGGNRRGPALRYVNLFVTMLLGGLWHGAGATYLVWGGLHGAYLILNHALCSIKILRNYADTLVFKISGNVVTMLAVMVAWVFFRANDLESALHILHTMMSPSSDLSSGVWQKDIPAGVLPHLGNEAWWWIAFLFPVVFLAPNAQTIVGWLQQRNLFHCRFQKASFILGLTIFVVIFIVSVTGVRNAASPFIYFNF
ncbi:MAG: MBOAT family protein [Alphaproteobacteria bacterium]|nr:MBOAT family protein [Alphaproteobacteria bacterium]